MLLQTLAKLVPTHRDLRVRLTIRNNSHQYDLFQQMNCSWENNWRSDNSGIVLRPHACTRNFLETVILLPGQSYQEEVWPLLIRRIKPGKAIFHFGLIRNRSNFTSEELKRIYHSSERHTYFSRLSTFSRFEREKDLFWSNPVTVVLRKEWIAR